MAHRRVLKQGVGTRVAGTPTVVKKTPLLRSKVKAFMLLYNEGRGISNIQLGIFAPAVYPGDRR